MKYSEVSCIVNNGEASDPGALRGKDWSAAGLTGSIPSTLLANNVLPRRSETTILCKSSSEFIKGVESVSNPTNCLSGRPACKKVLISFWIISPCAASRSCCKAGYDLRVSPSPTYPRSRSEASAINPGDSAALSLSR